jgi:hypothetical protein
VSTERSIFPELSLEEKRQEHERARLQWLAWGGCVPWRCRLGRHDHIERGRLSYCRRCGLLVNEARPAPQGEERAG